MSNILISIIIATKDRYSTLVECVKSLSKNYNNEKVELIIHDNSDNVDTEVISYIRKSFQFVNYYSCTLPLSQSENYNKGLEKARGYYVTMIGDDDTIADGLFNLLNLMYKYDLDAIYSGFSTYYWPGIKLRFNNLNTQISIPKNKVTNQILDPQFLQSLCLRNGCTELGLLPRLYYGIIKRTCLIELKNAAGTFFPGPSPDMANAFSASFFIKKYWHISYPIFIAGNSPSSAAGLGLQGRHVGAIEKMNFISDYTKRNWNIFIPKFWSGETIWAQSVYEACLKSGFEKLFEKNNFLKLYAKCLVFHFSFRSLIFNSFKAYNRNSNIIGKIDNINKILFYIILFINKRAVYFFINRVKMLNPFAQKKQSNQSASFFSIHDAERLVSVNVSSNNNFFAVCER